MGLDIAATPPESFPASISQIDTIPFTRRLLVRKHSNIEATGYSTSMARQIQKADEMQMQHSTYPSLYLDRGSVRGFQGADIATLQIEWRMSDSVDLGISMEPISPDLHPSLESCPIDPDEMETVFE